MSKTPRTDAAKAYYIEWEDRQRDSDMGGGRELVRPVAPDGWKTARELETELAAKEAECEALRERIQDVLDYWMGVGRFDFSKLEVWERENMAFDAWSDVSESLREALAGRKEGA